MTDYTRKAIDEVTEKIREIRESAGRPLASTSTEDGDHFSFRVPGTIPTSKTQTNKSEQK